MKFFFIITTAHHPDDESGKKTEFQIKSVALAVALYIRQY